jgi:cytochrome c-type biogenesis protein CcmH
MAGQLPPPEDADPQFSAMVAKLEQTLAERPNDMKGHRLLAGALMQLGRYGDAWRAYDRVIGLAGGAAGADIHAAKAEAMIMAAGGYVSPEASDAIARALERDPTLPMARYYGGLALRQAGRLDDAIAMWRQLRRESPPDAPYLDWLDAMLADAVAAREAGPGAPAASGPTTATAPEAPPGPTEEDIAAAGQMPAEDRAAMVEGMVARLENRLVAQGGTAEEWLRLIRSFVQLDRPADARRAYALAAAALANDPAAGFVREQALLMGVSVE